MSCKHCNGAGWYADGEADNPIQVQCGYCMGTGLDTSSANILLCVNACRDIPQAILEQPDYSIKAELDSLDDQIQKRMKAEERVRELEAFIREEADDLRDAGYSVDADRFIEFVNNKTLASNKE
jgi:PAS domain-containing protein